MAGHLVRTVVLAGLLALAPAAYAFDPATEAQNFGKGNERAAIYSTPEYQALLRQVSVQNRVAAMAMQAADPERDMLTHLCSSGEDGCAGDVRLYDWETKGYGIVKKVLWTARNGATISGHVWATKAGPAKRPGIVITNGSVQADEQLYWFVAQTLAKQGYVVLTWDPQGQGQSDTSGEGADQQEGVPAQSDGRPFFDGTQDALDFFFSTPSKPYVPRKSCETGTSHAAKQERRVKAGFNEPGYNPFWELLDASRVGIAGHSYGAEGVSYIGQFDPRVKAIVAWDNLGGTNPNESFIGSNPSEQPCPGDPSQRAVVPITKPALGMSADYFIPPTPNTSDPDPLAKSDQSFKYSKAGVDTGELIIRGGTHYDFDWIPNPGFPATLRGADMITWYTSAWFDKYVRGDASADARLLTNRWRADAPEAAVDPNGDGNMFSAYYKSRLDIGLSGGGRFLCEDMRPGCTGTAASDGRAAKYQYIDIVTSPDSAGAGSGVAADGGIRGCSRKANRVVPLHYKVRIVRATVYINGKRVRVLRGRSLKRVRIPDAGSGRHVVKIVLRSARGRKYTSVRTYKGCTKTKPRRVRSRR